MENGPTWRILLRQFRIEESWALNGRPLLVVGKTEALLSHGQ
jgi:hypothetical protein